MGISTIPIHVHLSQVNIMSLEGVSTQFQCFLHFELIDHLHFTLFDDILIHLHAIHRFHSRMVMVQTHSPKKYKVFSFMVQFDNGFHRGKYLNFVMLKDK